MWDALQMDEKNCTAGSRAPAPRSELPEPAPRPVLQHAAASIFVDAAMGSDTAAGSKTAPLKTVEAAVAKARKAAGAPSTIVLRGGTYYLKDTLALTAADSGLTVESYTGEVAELSGAHLLTALDWKPVNVSNNDELCMKNEELCIKNEELCIENDGFCRSAPTPRPR